MSATNYGQCGARTNYSISINLVRCQFRNVRLWVLPGDTALLDSGLADYSRHIRRMLSSRGTKAGPTKDRDSLDKALSKISRILITRTFSMHKD